MNVNLNWNVRGGLNLKFSKEIPRGATWRRGRLTPDLKALWSFILGSSGLWQVAFSFFSEHVSPIFWEKFFSLPPIPTLVIWVICHVSYIFLSCLVTVDWLKADNRPKPAFPWGFWNQKRGGEYCHLCKKLAGNGIAQGWCTKRRGEAERKTPGTRCIRDPGVSVRAIACRFNLPLCSVRQHTPL